MKRIVFTVFLVLLFALTGHLFACSWIGDPEPPLQYLVSKTEKIFIGKISRISFREEKHNGRKYNVQRVSIDVEKIFKGSIGKTAEVILFERKLRSSCDAPMPRLTVGKTYLFSDGENHVYTSREMKIGIIEYKQNENSAYVKQLEELSKQSATLIYGQLDEFSVRSIFPKRVANIEVTIERNGNILKTQTAPNGMFEFAVPDGGIYKVRFSLPFKAVNFYSDLNISSVFDVQTQSYHFDYEVSVKSRDAEYNYILLNSSDSEKQ